MPKIYVKPAEGLTMPRPDGTSMPAAGDWLEHDAYVRRRLKAGDLLKADPPGEGAPEDSTEEAAGDASSGTDDAKAAEYEAAASPRRRTR
ncbi:DUF2635 domain-containing protein [Azorhizobium caulinodans]|uniref:DUF2635 domain-containing protein n=1 Tax=Azorhizobium caulinodans TaxID=7 RepID=UPI002FBDA964